jgi:hypothetical protein
MKNALNPHHPHHHLLLLLLLLQSFQILVRLPNSLLFCREFLNFNSSLQTCTQEKLEERKNIRAQSKSAAFVGTQVGSFVGTHVGNFVGDFGFPRFAGDTFSHLL